MRIPIVKVLRDGLGSNFSFYFIGTCIACIALLSPSQLLKGQTLHTVYSGLQKASSFYVGQNSMYIVEQGRDRVLKLDLEGKLLETIGGRGSGDYEFSKPVDIDATNGLKIYVTDQNNRRVQLFGRRGEYLGSIQAEVGFGNQRTIEPGQVAVSEMGELYVTDVRANELRNYDLDSNLLNQFRIPAEISEVRDMQISSNEIYILDLESETIHRLSLNGQYLGFYVAVAVSAFYNDKTGMWTAGSDQLKLENRDKKPQSWSFDLSTQPIDLQVKQDKVYILTPDALYSLLIRN